MKKEEYIIKINDASKVDGSRGICRVLCEAAREGDIHKLQAYLTEENLALKDPRGMSVMDAIQRNNVSRACYKRLKEQGKLPGQKLPTLSEQLAAVEKEIQRNRLAALTAALRPTAERLRAQIAEEAVLAIKN